MEQKNTTLDDIAAVIGFSGALILAAWFGDGNSNLYVPEKAEEGQLLVKLLGLSRASAMSRSWPSEYLAVPRIKDYDDLVRKRIVGRMFEKDFGTREIAGHLRISERRVQQICRELEVQGLIPVQGPKNIPGKTPRKNPPGKARGKNAPGKDTWKKGEGGTDTALPDAFFAG